MSLPYRWHPTGTRVKRKPEPGDHIPYEHAVWRVIDVRRREHESGRLWVAHIRPITATVIDGMDLDLHLSKHFSWDVYPDEHYPVCAKCLEPQPCREVMAERVSDAAGKHVARYAIAGVCPACGEVVTARQKFHTYVENVEDVTGPAVTFHTRKSCFGSLLHYDEKWAAQTGGRPTYSCSGHVEVHADEYECSEGVGCPGPQARHRSARVCGCCPRPSGIYPMPTVQRIQHEGFPTTRTHS